MNRRKESFRGPWRSGLFLAHPFPHRLRNNGYAFRFALDLATAN